MGAVACVCGGVLRRFGYIDFRFRDITHKL